MDENEVEGGVSACQRASVPEEGWEGVDEDDGGDRMLSNVNAPLWQFAPRLSTFYPAFRKRVTWESSTRRPRGHWCSLIGPSN